MKIEKTFIFLIFYLITSLSFGQNISENKITELIDKLNWESVDIDCQIILVLTQSDSISNELVKIGKPATEKLLTALKNPEKTVAIHIILTRIYEDTKRKAEGLGTKYIYKDCKKLNGWHHLYNGITWNWNSKDGLTINQNQVDIAYNYWNKKLILKENVKMQKSEEIFANLDKEDKIKFPCIDNRNYENNSEFIKYEELKNIIGLKLKNENLINLMDRLGNDTIKKKFDDSYFIQNDTDGIQFKFSRNDSLMRIFIAEEYKGTLWKDLSFNYKKSKVLRKLPKPDERKSGGGKQERFWFREGNLEIFFNADETIKYIMIGL